MVGERTLRLGGESVEVDYVVEEEVRVQLGDRIGVPGENGD